MKERPKALHPDVDGYNELLSEQTAQRYGDQHVVPLTGGGDNSFLFEWECSNGHRWGYIRGSYMNRVVRCYCGEVGIPVS